MFPLQNINYGFQRRPHSKARLYLKSKPDSDFSKQLKSGIQLNKNKTLQLDPSSKDIKAQQNAIRTVLDSFEISFGFDIHDPSIKIGDLLEELASHINGKPQDDDTLKKVGVLHQLLSHLRKNNPNFNKKILGYDYKRDRRYSYDNRGTNCIENRGGGKESTSWTSFFKDWLAHQKSLKSTPRPIMPPSVNSPSAQSTSARPPSPTHPPTVHPHVPSAHSPSAHSPSALPPSAHSPSALPPSAHSPVQAQTLEYLKIMSGLLGQEKVLYFLNTILEQDDKRIMLEALKNADLLAAMNKEDISNVAELFRVSCLKAGAENQGDVEEAFKGLDIVKTFTLDIGDIEKKVESLKACYPGDPSLKVIEKVLKGLKSTKENFKKFVKYSKMLPQLTELLLFEPPADSSAVSQAKEKKLKKAKKAKNASPLPSGLPNLGATCWLNAGIQNLRFLNENGKLFDFLALLETKQDSHKALYTALTELLTSTNVDLSKEVKRFVTELEKASPDEPIKHIGHDASYLIELLTKIFDLPVAKNIDPDPAADPALTKYFDQWGVGFSTVGIDGATKTVYPEQQKEATLAVQLPSVLHGAEIDLGDLFSQETPLGSDNQFRASDGREYNKKQTLLGTCPPQLRVRLDRKTRDAFGRTTSVNKEKVKRFRVKSNKNDYIYLYRFNTEKGKVEKVWYKVETEATHTGGWHFVSYNRSEDGKLREFNDSVVAVVDSRRYDLTTEMYLSKVDEPTILNELEPPGHAQTAGAGDTSSVSSSRSSWTNTDEDALIPTPGVRILQPGSNPADKELLGQHWDYKKQGNTVYQSPLDYTEVEHILKDEEIGSYFIRRSSTGRAYTLCYKSADGEIKQRRFKLGYDEINQKIHYYFENKFGSAVDYSDDHGVDLNKVPGLGNIVPQKIVKDIEKKLTALHSSEPTTLQLEFKTDLATRAAAGGDAVDSKRDHFFRIDHKMTPGDTNKPAILPLKTQLKIFLPEFDLNEYSKVVKNKYLDHEGDWTYYTQGNDIVLCYKDKDGTIKDIKITQKQEDKNYGAVQIDGNGRIYKHIVDLMNALRQKHKLQHLKNSSEYQIQAQSVQAVQAVQAKNLLLQFTSDAAEPPSSANFYTIAGQSARALVARSFVSGHEMQVQVYKEEEEDDDETTTLTLGDTIMITGHGEKGRNTITNDNGDPVRYDALARKLVSQIDFKSLKESLKSASRAKKLNIKLVMCHSALDSGDKNSKDSFAGMLLQKLYELIPGTEVEKDQVIKHIVIHAANGKVARFAAFYGKSQSDPTKYKVARYRPRVLNIEPDLTEEYVRYQYSSSEGITVS